MSCPRNKHIFRRGHLALVLVVVLIELAKPPGAVRLSGSFALPKFALPTMWIQAQIDPVGRASRRAVVGLGTCVTSVR